MQEGLSLAKAIAEVWLTYRFAVTPLVRSTMDLIEYFDSNFKPTRPPRQVARGIVKTRHYHAYDHELVYIAPSDVDTIHVVEKRTGTTRAYIVYTIDNPVADWRFHLGLRTSDIPHTLWQLLPYSFMIDRMVDISKAVKALTNLANPGLHILAAGVVDKTEDSFTYVHKKAIRASYWVTINGSTATGPAIISGSSGTLRSKM